MVSDDCDESYGRGRFGFVQNADLLFSETCWVRLAKEAFCGSIFREIDGSASAKKARTNRVFIGDHIEQSHALKKMIRGR
jgi:hypothetical protein